MISIDYTKENSSGVVSYMDALSLGVIGYLRSIKAPSLLDEQQLLQLVHDVMQRQEDQLENILIRVNYEIEDQSTLSLLGINVNEHSSSIGRVEGVSLPECSQTILPAHRCAVAVHSPRALYHNETPSQGAEAHIVLLARRRRV